MIKKLIPFLLVSVLFLSCKKDKIELTFHEVSSGSAGDMNGLFFLNDSVGYACGGERYLVGDMLKTTDGGNTWTAQTPNSGKAVYQPYFINADTGFAGAYEGKIISTVDGGKNWSLTQTPFWLSIRDLLFLNNSVGVGCGGSGFSHGVIVRTTDMGNTWASDTFPNELRGLYFTNHTTGYCCGYGIIMKTTDAGATWQFTPAKGDFFISIYFTDANTGFCVGLTGTILKTTDAGASWSKIRNGNSILNKRLNFTQIVFRNTAIGYAIGWDGLMMKTTDGGDNWSTVKNTPPADFNSISLTRTGGIIAASGGTIYSFSE